MGLTVISGNRSQIAIQMILSSAKSHHSGSSVFWVSVGAGLLLGSLVLIIGAVAPHGRLSGQPRLRKPFGYTGVGLFVVGLIMLIAGLAT
jgi:hypothetical protein